MWKHLEYKGSTMITGWPHLLLINSTPSRNSHLHCSATSRLWALCLENQLCSQITADDFVSKTCPKSDKMNYSIISWSKNVCAWKISAVHADDRWVLASLYSNIFRESGSERVACSASEHLASPISVFIDEFCLEVVTIGATLYPIVMSKQLHHHLTC
jgi:hypothetical protein